jgi:hypothetical protein
MKKILLAIFLLMAAFPLVAQVKFEQEIRVKRNAVPREAREWINDAFEGFKRVRWYYETTPEDNSYEAKFSWDGYLYSVKFDNEGKLVDIEKEITFEEITPGAKEDIRQYLEETYQRYRIIKVQRQFTGHEDDLEDYIDEDEWEDITMKYEIEFHGITSSENKLWEALFDGEGNLILLQEIQLPDLFNLDF